MSITKIAEEMIRREYNKKMVSLPPKFWNLPEYKPKYQMQLRHASKFVRTYGEDAVWNVLNKETWCFSLAAKSLPNLMEIEASKLANQQTLKVIQEARPKVEEDTSLPAFRATVSKRNILGE